jgi:sialic acid synthase SpsE
VGYSGHHNGIALDIAAFTLGASFIERHFTLDRTWKGTDHAASLEPDGLRRLSRNLDQVTEALTYKNQEILLIEKPQRAKLKWKK